MLLFSLSSGQTFYTALIATAYLSSRLQLLEFKRDLQLQYSPVPDLGQASTKLQSTPTLGRPSPPMAAGESRPSTSPNPFPWMESSNMEEFAKQIIPTSYRTLFERRTTRSLVQSLTAGKVSLGDISVHNPMIVGSCARRTALADDDVDFLLYLNQFPLPNTPASLQRLAGVLRSAFPTSNPRVDGARVCLLAGGGEGDGAHASIAVNVMLGKDLWADVGQFFLRLSPEERAVWAPSCARLHVQFLKNKCATHPNLRQAILCLKAWRNAQGLVLASWLLELLAVHAADALLRGGQALLPPPGAGGSSEECRVTLAPSGDLSSNPVTCMLGFALAVRRLVARHTPAVFWTKDTGGFYEEECTSECRMDAQRRRVPCVLDPVNPTFDLAAALSPTHWAALDASAAALLTHLLGRNGLSRRIGQSSTGVIELDAVVLRAGGTGASGAMGSGNASMAVHELCQASGIAMATDCVDVHGSLHPRFQGVLTVQCPMCPWLATFRGAVSKSKKEAKASSCAVLLEQTKGILHNRGRDCQRGSAHVGITQEVVNAALPGGAGGACEVPTNGGAAGSASQGRGAVGGGHSPQGVKRELKPQESRESKRMVEESGGGRFGAGPGACKGFTIGARFETREATNSLLSERLDA